VTQRPTPSLVSVAIPTYNRAGDLERAVASVVAQSHRELEIVISDNASTDATPTVCARLAAADPRLRVVRQPVNRGPVANFNAVLEQLRGEHVMLLADDDAFEHDLVERCLATFATEPRASIVHGRTCFVDGASEMLGTDFDVDSADPGRRVLDYLARVHDNGAFYGLMRADAMRAALPMPNMLGADWAWVARLAFQGTIHAQPATQLRRSYGGASTDFVRIARILGLPPRVARRPTANIVAGIHRDIASGSPVYGGLPRAARHRLALRAALELVRTHPSNLVIEELAPVLGRPGAQRAIAPVRDGLRRLRGPQPRPGRIVQRDRDAPPG